MAKPRLVIYKEKEAKSTRPVYIDTDLHAQLLALKAETGLTVNKIVQRFITYGLKNVEIEESEEEQ